MKSDSSHRHSEEHHVGRFDSGLAWRLFRYALPHKRWIALAVLLVLFVPYLDLAGVVIVKLVIDGPLAEIGSKDSALRDTNAFRELYFWVFVYFVVMLVYLFLRYFQNLLMAIIGQKVMRDVRMEVFTHLQRMSLSFYNRNPVGRLVTRLSNDVEALNQLFSSGVVTLIADVILLSVITFLLFYFNAQLALVTIAVAPFMLAVTFCFRYFARKFYREQREHLSHLKRFHSRVPFKE